MKAEVINSIPNCLFELELQGMTVHSWGQREIEPERLEVGEVCRQLDQPLLEALWKAERVNSAGPALHRYPHRLVPVSCCYVS